MFLAAAPYFQSRFHTDEWVLEHFQSAITSVSTSTNLVAMVVLTNIQYTASYPFRINTALFMGVGVFTLLTLSTKLFVDVSPAAYLGFLLAMVACAAWACGLIQNGAFAFAASFGRPEYTQAIMAGQGVAGVLPPIAQMATVLLFPAVETSTPDDASSSGSSSDSGSSSGPGSAATIYFMTAVLISSATLLAFQPLVRRHDRLVERRMAEAMAESVTSVEEAERAARRVVGMPALFRKLRWLAAAVFMCFVVAMFFPVFTTKILSVADPALSGPLFRPAAFIPLAFFFWNMGDLAGRVATALPASLAARRRPALLFAFSLVRWLFLPLYLLCNVRGRGARVPSDLFYLCLVQFPYGLTNGWLASSAMMAASDWVDDGEREAAGSFMGMCLVAGLTVGSLLSFTAAGI